MYRNGEIIQFVRENDSEKVDKVSFCRFDAISVHFPRAFVISSNIVKTKAEQYSIGIVRCSVLLQKHTRVASNESKNRKISTSSRFYATCKLFLNCLGIRKKTLQWNVQKKEVQYVGRT